MQHGNGTPGAEEGKRSGEQGTLEEARKGIGGAEGEIERAEGANGRKRRRSSMSSGSVKEELDQAANRAGAGATPRRTEQGERDPVWAHSRVGKETGRARRRRSRKDGKKRLLREEVTEEDIAEVVSSWTHIPVSRLQEGEREKLVKMEEHLHQRVIGQEEAIKAVANAVRRARAVCRIRIGRSARLFFSDRPASAKPNCLARWPNFCSTTRTP